MPKTLALLHTGQVVIPMFDELCRELLPGVRIFHFLDESLIKNTVAAGKMEKASIRQIMAHIQSARDAGADALLLTCSSVGKAIDIARQLFDFPLLRVDEPMAQEAIRIGQRIGVLATLRTTLEPTTQLLKDTAAALGQDREIIPTLCEGAYDAVTSGNPARHDQLVAESLTALVPRVDAIVLAQASMARVVRQIPPEAITVPVLSSPRSGVERARDILLGTQA
jgi:Asp/Glu/hydantoin racemase